MEVLHGIYTGKYILSSLTTKYFECYLWLQTVATALKKEIYTDLTWTRKERKQTMFESVKNCARKLPGANIGPTPKKKDPSVTQKLG